MCLIQSGSSLTTMLGQLSAPLYSLLSGQSAVLLSRVLPVMLQQLPTASFSTKKAAGDNKPAKDKQGKQDKSKSSIPRALSAYNIFVKDQAPARKGAAELLRSLAAEWKIMSDEAKRPYQQQATEMKESNARAREAAKASRGPQTAYAAWCCEQVPRIRAADPALKPTDAMKQAAAAWKALAPADKEARQRAAKEARDAWKQQQQT